MYSPKEEVYSVLNTIADVKIAQSGEVIRDDLPKLTFYTMDNRPHYDLNKDIQIQDVVVMVDVWTSSSVAGTDLANEVEDKMKTINFLVDFSHDIPTIDRKFYHKAIRFIAIKV